MKRMTFLPHPNSSEDQTGGVNGDPVSDIIDPTSSSAQDDGTDKTGDPATTVAAQADGDDGGGTKMVA